MNKIFFHIVLYFRFLFLFDVMSKSTIPFILYDVYSLKFIIKIFFHVKVN